MELLLSLYFYTCKDRTAFCLSNWKLWKLRLWLCLSRCLETYHKTSFPKRSPKTPFCFKKIYELSSSNERHSIFSPLSRKPKPSLCGDVFITKSANGCHSSITTKVFSHWNSNRISALGELIYTSLNHHIRIQKASFTHTHTHELLPVS